MATRTADEENLASNLLDALARRMLVGDVGAERDLVKLLLPLVNRCVTVTLKGHVIGGIRACSIQEIEDLSQDAFLKLLVNDYAVLRTWAKVRRPLIPYVWRTTSHLVIDHLRIKRTNPRTNVPLPDDPGIYEDWNDPEAELEAADFERSILAKLRLGKVSGKVLELSRKGLSNKEIAEKTGTSRAAVLNHRSRIAAAVRLIVGLGSSKQGKKS